MPFFKELWIRRVRRTDGKAIEMLMRANVEFMDAQYPHALAAGKPVYGFSPVPQPEDVPKSKEDFARRVRKSIERGEYSGNIAIAKGKGIVGFVGFEWQPGITADSRYADLVEPTNKPYVHEPWLIVDKEFAKKGFGLGSELRKYNLNAVRQKNGVFCISRTLGAIMRREKDWISALDSLFWESFHPKQGKRTTQLKEFYKG